MLKLKFSPFQFRIMILEYVHRLCYLLIIKVIMILILIQVVCQPCSPILDLMSLHIEDIL